MADSQPPPAKRQKIASHTTTVINQNPTSRVFTVVEILEKVLLHLSVMELTRVERVNSLWKTLIRETSSLQEQRFLKAAPVTSVLSFVPEQDVKNLRRHPLHMSRRPHLSRPCPTDSHECPLSRPRVVCRMHPYFPAPHPTFAKGCAMQIKVRLLDILSWELGPWENILLSQPPCMLADVKLMMTHRRKVRVRPPNEPNIGRLPYRRQYSLLGDGHATLGDFRGGLEKFVALAKGELGKDWRVDLMIEGSILETDTFVQIAMKNEKYRLSNAKAIPDAEAEI